MRGGKRIGAGRPPKADEDKIIQKLAPLEELAFKALEDGLAKGDYNFTKLYMDYYYGKPKERIEHSGDFPMLWQEERFYETHAKAN